jgi:hypothetical protein
MRQGGMHSTERHMSASSPLALWHNTLLLCQALLRLPCAHGLKDAEPLLLL